MQRTVVIRTDADGETKLNDDIGLPPIVGYTIAEYLEDLATYEGRQVIAQCGGAYAFSDGTVELLTERRELVPLEILDVETRAIVVQRKLQELPQLTLDLPTFVC